MGRSIAENIAWVRKEIEAAALRGGRDPRNVRLMAVTKRVTDDRIREAVAAGIRLFGENYVQEAQSKIPLFPRDLEWHMIGRLQTRKSKHAITLFHALQSLDRIELAAELDKRCGAVGICMPVLIEVNTGDEETKGGVAPRKLAEFVRAIALLDNIAVRGLMTMPPWFDDPEQARPYFRLLRELREEIAALDIPRVDMSELSMGMSDDFAVAVEEGATIVRVGRAIFGERSV
jgi:pyridoxal phosphate enzyme (YggS family)